MAGLLGDVLPWAYSQGDRAKRYLGGLLSDPIGTAQQAAGQFQDNARAQEATMGRAFEDPNRPFQVTDQNALMQAVNGVMNGPMGFAPVGMTAWHGSPHTFDRFDSSKIGTGEGAQSYGHGLYLAESPAVAKSYQQDLSTTVKVDGRPVLANNKLYPTGNPLIDDNLVAAGGDLKRAVSDQLNGLRNQRQYIAQQQRAGAPVPNPDALKEFQRELVGLRALRGRVETTMDGNLYKVDLPDGEVAKMLDYDKPLSQQQHLLPQLRSIAQDAPNLRDALQSFELGSTTGDTVYRALQNDILAKKVPQPGALLSMHPDRVRAMRADVDASQMLRSAGIPGIRYLDGVSRGAGSGSTNFVVFPGEENILKILERNGQPVR